MTILSVRIRNFRSIVDDEFAAKDLTVIVGPNDVGKSNYLRALNLFFNGQTDVGSPFAFDSDYSLHAPIRKGKAKELSVHLTVQAPSSYSEQRPIVWTRIWREGRSDVFNEIRRAVDGTELSPRSRFGAYLDRVKFKYVPATKGDQYFRSLLRDLHDTLAETIDVQLRGASEEFIGKIRGATGEISASVLARLSLKSEIQIPRDLRTLFEVLDFETAHGSKAVSLKQRGDGIKVRHIPAILKFLADQEEKLAVKGRPRVTTIWGYEEPENNLELSKAFELGREFLEYSSNIQTFITTHSAAFYALARSEKDRVIALHADGTPADGTKLTRMDPEALGDVDKSMGLMELVTPYLATAESNLSELKTKVSTLEAGTKPVVFVGGETDANYLVRAVDVFGKSALLKNLEITFIGHNQPQGPAFAGDSALQQTIKFLRANPGFSQRKILVLFDCDANAKDEEFGKVRVRGIKQNLENTKVHRGIENLFPTDLFEDKFYSTKISRSPYGEEIIARKFEKTEFCEHICGGVWTKEQLENWFAKFGPIVGEIEALVSK